MTDELIRRDTPPAAGAERANARLRRTFRPTVTPEGELKAGGCTLGRVEAGPDGPVLVVPDRYRRRCQARGTDDVAVNLREALREAEKAVGEGNG
jgi:hypothetical protein